MANTEAERGDGDGGLAGGSCDNNASKGDVSLCNALRAPSGPACEGFSSLVDECRGLGGGPGGLDFKPVIAEAIAACIYKRSGTRALCRRSLARDCVKEAIKNTCIEGAAAKKCDALTAECNALGHKVRFKRSDCESAMSVLTDTGLATWSQNVTGPTREGCTFDYFLPYYPFGKN